MLLRKRSNTSLILIANLMGQGIINFTIEILASKKDHQYLIELLFYTGYLLV